MTDERSGRHAPRVLVFHDQPEPYVDELRARFPALRIETSARADDLASHLARFQPEIVFSIKSEALPGAVHQPLLQSESIRWIQVGGAGVDHLGRWDAARVTVTNCAGVLSPHLAETVIGAILMLNFGFPAYIRQQTSHTWRQLPWKPLAGRTLVIVGLGNIGRQVAIKAKLLGLNVLAVQRSPVEDPNADEVLPIAALHEAFARADFATLHVPLTEGTRHLIDREALSALPCHAFLINTSRGPIVEEAALLEALRGKRIAGAYLDVFEQEPLPPESPFWDLENLVISPHVADSIEHWQSRFAAFFGDNLGRWLSGQALRNVVSPERGY